MAIYHLSMKAVSRSAGRSSTAAAAYRAGCEIADQRTGEVHDYRRKAGVESADIVMPDGVPSMSRSELWNGVEKHHKRGDAVVAREFEVALPDELSPAERRRLAVDFAREVANRYGVTADVCIHEPSKDGDERNFHAHILLSACTITKEGFGKKAAELDPIHCQRQKIANPAEEWRERWADLTNQRLRENEVSARVDHRSLKEQGIEREPTVHLGPSVTAMEKRGVRTEVQERIDAAALRMRQVGEALMRQAEVLKAQISDLAASIIELKLQRFESKADAKIEKDDAAVRQREADAQKIRDQLEASSKRDKWRDVLEQVSKKAPEPPRPRPRERDRSQDYDGPSI